MASQRIPTQTLRRRQYRMRKRKPLDLSDSESVGTLTVLRRSSRLTPETADAAVGEAAAVGRDEVIGHAAGL